MREKFAVILFDYNRVNNQLLKKSEKVKNVIKK
jgi:hypothetical protein